MIARRSFLLSILLLAGALAGCAENGGDDGTTTTTPATTTTPTGTGSQDRTPNIDTVRVGTDAAYAPFEDTLTNGEIVGFDIDVMREVANRSGFEVTFQNSGFSAIIPSVQSGQFDAGISAFTINDERKAQVDFSVPYYDNRLMAAVLADNQDIKTEGDLEGKKVCTQEGTTSEFYLRDNLGFDNDSLVLLPTAPPCADALKRGDVQALMIDAAFVRTVIESSGGELKSAFIIDADEQFGIVVKKGNTELLTAINQALVAMKGDGTLERLQDKWQV